MGMWLNQELRNVGPRRLLRAAGWFGALLVVATFSWVGQASGQAARGLPEGTQYEYRDLTRELSNKMTGTYTVTVVGDVLMQAPMSKMMSPELLEVLRGANTTVGNAEVYIVDQSRWPYPFGNNWTPKEMAQDYADMGFDMLVSGEAAGGEEGMKSTMHFLDQVGIPLAGYGPNLTVARLPVLQYLPQGRVALIAAYPVPNFGAGSGGPSASGATGSDGWGLNPLRLTVTPVVTPEHLESLKAIRDEIVSHRNDPDVARPIPVPEDLPDRVTIFNSTFLAGPKAGVYHYEVNQADRQANILALRNAKEFADFAMFSMHVHQNRYAFQAYSQDHYPAQYLIDLCHDMVDNGMDIYVGHGNHTMQGIEIYKGRPIFYNSGNFSVHRFGYENESGSSRRGPPGSSSPSNPAQTSIERGELGNQWLQQPINQAAYVSRVTYQDGKLTEIRIYPIDLGGQQGPNRRTWSRTDIPTLATGDRGLEILNQIQEYSRPFGTEISIEDGIGVIRVPPEATVPVGVGLRENLGGR